MDLHVDDEDFTEQHHGCVVTPTAVNIESGLGNNSWAEETDNDTNKYQCHCGNRLIYLPGLVSTMEEVSSYRKFTNDIFQR